MCTRLQHNITLSLSLHPFPETANHNVQDKIHYCQAALRVEVKKFKKPSNVRWLSVESAAEAVHESWTVLVATLENESLNKKLTEPQKQKVWRKRSTLMHFWPRHALCWMCCALLANYPKSFKKM
jgi:hypothetical protein